MHCSAHILVKSLYLSHTLTGTYGEDCYEGLPRIIFFVTPHLFSMVWFCSLALEGFVYLVTTCISFKLNWIVLVPKQLFILIYTILFLFGRCTCLWWQNEYFYKPISNSFIASITKRIPVCILVDDTLRFADADWSEEFFSFLY